MLSFVLKRLVVIPLALALANFCGYVYAHVARVQRTAQNPFGLAEVEASPVWPAYQAYVQGVLSGDFGAMPYASGRDSIIGAVGRFGLNSLGLLAPALMLSIVFGLMIGMRSVRAEPPRIATWLTALTTMGLALPSFYLGSLFVAAAVAYVLWGPARSSPLPIGGFGWDRHMVLPLMVLTLRPMMQIAQVTSSLLVGELSKQYVVAARSVGHSWRAIFRRYAFRNILAAVIVTIAGTLRLSIGELVVVERLFEWPGFGSLLGQTLVPAHLSGAHEAVLFLHPPVVAGLFTVLAAVFLCADLLAAILARSVDPRLRMR